MSSYKKYLFIFIIAFLVMARVVAPAIILKKTNAYLSTFSESYYAHIEDFNLSLWRGAYGFENVIVALKEQPINPFLKVDNIDVSVAWSQLFQGKILTVVMAHKAELFIEKAFSNQAQPNTKTSLKEAGQAGKKLFPVNIERIELKDSEIKYSDYELSMDKVEGRMSHVTATPSNPITLLTLQGLFLGKTPLKILGHLNTTTEPVDWLMAFELQKMHLPGINHLVKKRFPLSFKSGVLDIYSEVKSEKSKITGYVKPFLKDADVVGDDQDFKGIKHFGIEVTTAAMNLFFRSNESHTVATKVLFSYEDKKFEWNASETLKELFTNGYKQELAPGLENKMVLSNQNYNKKEN